MSGDATAAYAFLLQAINTCLLLDGHEVGRTDISYLASKLRSLYSDSRREVTDLPSWQNEPDVPVLDVVLFGWSWRRLRFEAYSFTYNRHGELVMRRLDDLEEEKPYGVYFAGDASGQARTKIRELLEKKGAPRVQRAQADSKQQAKEANLDWEPLEVLKDLIEDPQVRTVGGVPQMLRIYQYGLAETFVWRDDSGDYFGGREVKFGERFDRRIARFVDGQVVVQHSDRSIASEAGAAEQPSGNVAADVVEFRNGQTSGGMK